MVISYQLVEYAYTRLFKKSTLRFDNLGLEFLGVFLFGLHQLYPVVRRVAPYLKFYMSEEDLCDSSCFSFNQLKIIIDFTFQNRHETIRD